MVIDRITVYGRPEIFYRAQINRLMNKSKKKTQDI